MQRYNHKINGSFHQFNSIGTLIPSFMYEVAPGESWTGSIDLNFLSVPTNEATLNRVFFDHYIFYVPYRLVWDDFPDFIQQRESGMNQDDAISTYVPMMKGVTATDIDEALSAGDNALWIKQKLYEDPQNAGDYGYCALPTWCYYLIYNTAFRQQNQDSVAYPTTVSVLQSAFYENNDFFVKAAREDSQTDYSIGSTVDSTRSAFAKDAFNKRRDRLGDKYSDYLRTQGDRDWETKKSLFS